MKIKAVTAAIFTTLVIGVAVVTGTAQDPGSHTTASHVKVNTIVQAPCTDGC